MGAEARKLPPVRDLPQGSKGLSAEVLYCRRSLVPMTYVVFNTEAVGLVKEVIKKSWQ